MYNLFRYIYFGRQIKSLEKYFGQQENRRNKHLSENLAEEKNMNMNFVRDTIDMSTLIDDQTINDLINDADVTVSSSVQLLTHIFEKGPFLFCTDEI